MWEGKLKKTVDEYYFTQTDYKNFAPEIKETIINFGSTVLSNAYMSHGFLEIAGKEEVSLEKQAILKRFAKVFDQTYTRFLDIQKAEAQAREAQIEAALERIRAAAMAMHRTEELTNVVRVLRKQMADVGETEMDSIVIHLYQDGADTFEGWFGYRRKDNPTGPVQQGYCVIDWNKTKRAREDQAKYYSNEQNYTIVGDKKFLHEWYQYLEEVVPISVDHDAEGKLMIPNRLFYNYSKFSKGAILLITNEEASESAKYLLRRAADVFNLAYTRFLDLQKAEAQAQEAKIEAALERVRAASMAMHQSNELNQLIANVFEQLLHLGFDSMHCEIILFDEQTQNCEIWPADEAENLLPKSYRVPNNKRKFYQFLLNSWKTRHDYHPYHLKGRTKRDYEHWLFTQTDWKDIPKSVQESMQATTSVNLYGATMKYGILEVASLATLSTSQFDIVKRFARVFEQSYTRFLDLLKAEAQAREALIEASLERTRAKSLAMHRSDELGALINDFYHELMQLDIQLDRCMLMIVDPENEDITWWIAGKEGLLSDNGFLVKKNRYALHRALIQGWKERRRKWRYLLKGREKKRWDQFAFTKTDLTKLPKVVKKDMLSNEHIHLNISCDNFGFLLAGSIDPLTDEQQEIISRFAAAFNLTYTRFLDLKKAEAQARESDIEVSLERVRAQAMAMQSSRDLGQVAHTIFQELDRLQISSLRCGIGIIDRDTQQVDLWTTTTTKHGGLEQVVGSENLSGHPLLTGIYKSWLKQKTFAYTLKGKSLQKYYQLVSTTNFKLPKSIRKGPVKNTQHHYVCVMYPAGGLYGFSEHPFSQEAIEIMQRFANGFHLAYTRYEDLKQAEARAQQATRSAALNRIRAEIASMRSTADLERITPLIWKELTTLEIPFFRCGVFIVDEASESVQVFLTTPTGEAQTSFTIPYGMSPDMDANIIHWRQGKIYQDQWTRDRFVNWTQSLIEMGLVESSEAYSGGAEPPERISLHFLPFEQGMLYVGNHQPLHTEQLDITQSLADAFSVAYARYEDFIKLEEAKSRIESTLQELQAAQAQLIQAEKMASLGELTAGIAHEIQNPLNFVNNFSEVSSELIAEAKTELDQGDMEEAQEILADLIENLDKINHHGQRASSIVKGMLDHSRTSTGEKVPTDINLLCDEYLRLAYHGMRAKDKSFNASYETDFQEKMPLVSLVPQEIGRVLLNLINNAFQACLDKAQEEAQQPTIGEAYRAQVNISTKHIAALDEGKQDIQIIISDNGPGIPEEIKDKIFQPFFTTKSAGQGTGLGLSLSYDIINAHGGSIEILESVAPGTTFQIRIPAK